MWFRSVFASWRSGSFRNRRLLPARLRSFRPRLEVLEDRALPSAYTANVAADLINDINAANAAGGANTITLAAPTTAPYVLTAVNNRSIPIYGNTGLPPIAANDNLTIVGNGDTIERSAATGTPYFRLLQVVSGGSLTLENLTLQGGMIEAFQDVPGGEQADGGAIFNEGTLVLNGVTVQDNAAGFSGVPPYLHNDEIAVHGGGIYSFGGAVTLEGGTIVQNNEALGTDLSGGRGGLAYGGGVYVSGGTLSVTSTTLDNNTATAGAGLQLAAYGGGMYVSTAGATASEGTVALNNVTLDGNAATAYETSYGGGLYLSSEIAVIKGASVGAATLTNCTVQGNSAYQGGGLYVVVGGGSAASADTLIDCTVEGNSTPAYSGSEGGGLHITGGFVTLQGDTIESNSATAGYGGGIYIVSGATVYLDSFTVANTISNTDATGLNGSTANIDGTVISPLSPTVVNAASANPSPVTGTTTNLSVLGNDPAGASSLTYTWAVTSVPAGAATPTFSSNASQSTTATFYRAGTYTFQATITDPLGLSAVSSVTVTVVQSLTSLSVMPGNVTLADGTKQQFTAMALDQFGQGKRSPEPGQPG